MMASGDNGAGGRAEPSLAWEQHADALAGVAGPALQAALINGLARDSLLRDQIAAFRGEVAERDGQFLATLARIERVGLGVAVRVGRLDKEREITRAEVREVHRWAEEMRRDADASHQRELVSAQRAASVLAELGDAKIDEARAEAKLDVTRTALQSLATETTAGRVERRARPWQLTTIALAALLGALATGGAGVGVWWITRPPAPAMTQGK